MALTVRSVALCLLCSALLGRVDAIVPGWGGAASSVVVCRMGGLGPRHAAPPCRLRSGPPLLLLLLLVLLVLVGQHPHGLAGAKVRGRDTATARGANPLVDEHGLPRRKGGRAEASDHQRAQLPDRSDKRVARQLQCSICVATVHEVALALPAGRKAGQVKEWEIAEAMEDLCLELEAYGLALEYNVPTTRYSNDKRNGRHKGNWIEKYAVNKCGDICKNDSNPSLESSIARLGG
eukprot:COSAG02_NODE_6449_length_3563_cov_2.977194_3_plen_235_part_00